MWIHTIHPTIKHELGWLWINNYDELGSRPIPSFPENSKACISVYGDSFAESFGVKDNEAWVHNLAKNLDCRVNNFGVGFYSTAQALRRYETQIATYDIAPVVVLGFNPENIIRNVNRNRFMAYNEDNFAPFASAPIYKLISNGELEFVPSPDISIKEYEQFLEKPEKYIPDDYFAPNGLSGKKHFVFPYFPKLIISYFKLIKKPYPHHQYFFQNNHESKAFETTIAIFEKFRKIAISRNQKPIIAILSGIWDFDYYKKHKEFPAKPIIDYLNDNNFNIIDTSNALLKEIEPDFYYNKIFIENDGHYNAYGNELVATEIFKYISNMGDNN